MFKLHLSTEQYKELTKSTLKEKSTAFFIGLLVTTLLVTHLSVRYHLISKIKKLPAAASLAWVNMTKAPPITDQTIKIAKNAPIPPTLKPVQSITTFPTPTTINHLYATAIPSPTITLAPSATPTIVPTFSPTPTLTLSISPTIVTENGQTSSTKTDRVTFKGNKYVVKEGDSLASIAQEVYGDPNAWTIIAKANNLQNSNSIEVGMELKLPR